MSFHGHDSFADNPALAPAEPSLDADGGDVVGGNTIDEHAQSEEGLELPKAPPGGPKGNIHVTDSDVRPEALSDVGAPKTARPGATANEEV
eukprot:COSAG02_NODE_41087_length_398_cov_0.869565_1_plen_91_part_00